MYEFKILENDKIPWDKIENCYDHTVFKSKVWLDFLVATQNIKPFVIEIYDNLELIGFFVGEKFTKLFNIVASPFEGWTTSSQGLSMLSPINKDVRIDIYKAIISFLFKNKHCTLFQAADWHLDIEIIKNNSIGYEVVKGYKLDLTQQVEQIYKKFSSSSCQYAIRKSKKYGVIIREPENIDQFVVHYYKQLIEVFRKQGMKPTYSVERIYRLVESLEHSNKLLLLEAITSDYQCIATGIFVGDNGLAYFWGGASYSQYQYLCPNEPLMYEAIKFWKKKGYKEFDLGGVRNYKKKFGPSYYEKPKITVSKYRGVLEMKNYARKCYYGIREIGAEFKKLKFN